MTIIVYMFEYQHPLIFHIKVCLGTMTREGTNLTCLDCILLWHLWNILCNTLCCVECWHQAIFLIILIRSSILIRYVRYIRSHHTYKGFPGGSEVKKCLPAMRETWVRSLGWEDPLEKEMATHSSILPGKSHGWRRLVGYSPRGCKESDMSEQLTPPLHQVLLWDVGSNSLTRDWTWSPLHWKCSLRHRPPAKSLV